MGDKRKCENCMFSTFYYEDTDMLPSKKEAVCRVKDVKIVKWNWSACGDWRPE